MVRVNTTTWDDFVEKQVSQIERNFFGYDRLLNNLRAVEFPKDNFPPYNVVKHDDLNFTIELAVAGFSIDDVEITRKIVDGQAKLEIAGEQGESEAEYTHKGIAGRKFKRVFNLADTVEIKSAKLVNGILSIDVENVIPDEEKPQVIKISNK